jgi:hypothetical protein
MRLRVPRLQAASESKVSKTTVKKTMTGSAVHAPLSLIRFLARATGLGQRSQSPFFAFTYFFTKPWT